jgi:ABC-type amino acid transport substrate-binding protein
MRGRRRTVASVLAETLAARPGSGAAAIAAAVSEACGPRLAREVSFRGVLRDGRLLLLVRSEAWAEQVRGLEADLCRSVNGRLGRTAAVGLDVRVGAAGP